MSFRQTLALQQFLLRLAIAMALRQQHTLDPCGRGAISSGRSDEQIPAGHPSHKQHEFDPCGRIDYSKLLKTKPKQPGSSSSSGRLVEDGEYRVVLPARHPYSNESRSLGLFLWHCDDRLCEADDQKENKIRWRRSEDRSEGRRAFVIFDLLNQFQ